MSTDEHRATYQRGSGGFLSDLLTDAEPLLAAMRLWMEQRRAELTRGSRAVNQADCPQSQERAVRRS
jgi:hypothetical protein